MFDNVFFSFSLLVSPHFPTISLSRANKTETILTPSPVRQRAYQAWILSFVIQTAQWSRRLFSLFCFFFLLFVYLFYLIAAIFYFLICDYFVDTFSLQRFFLLLPWFLFLSFSLFSLYFRYICEVPLTLISVEISCFRILAIGYISGLISP